MKPFQNAPDFIIAGAMKSATSSLHRILSAWEGVFLPSDEVNFFTMPGISSFPMFHDHPASKKTRAKQKRALTWYRDKFRSAPVLGERSTSYLDAPGVPARIRTLLPDVRLIIMLRNPVDRAYSHYWHNVRTGRAVSSFRQTLARNRDIIEKGYYRKHVRRYLRHFPADQIKFIFFERFVHAMRTVLDELQSFLHLDGAVPLEQLDTQRNPGRYPLSYPFQLKWNQLSRRLVPFRDLGQHPGRPEDYFKKTLFLVDRYFRRLLNVTWKKKPEMDRSVRSSLQRLYRKKNRDLSSYIGKDPAPYWPFMKEQK